MASVLPDCAAPLTTLRGVGPAWAAKLERAGLRSVRDLLLLLPRRVVRWPERLAIAEARERMGERVTVRGEVRGVRLARLGGRRSLVRVEVADDSGSITAMFFNQQTAPSA